MGMKIEGRPKRGKRTYIGLDIDDADLEFIKSRVLSDQTTTQLIRRILNEWCAHEKLAIEAARKQREIEWDAQDQSRAESANATRAPLEQLQRAVQDSLKKPEHESDDAKTAEGEGTNG